MMLVFIVLGDFSRVRVSRLVVMIVRLLCLCVLLIIGCGLMIWLEVLGYCMSMLDSCLFGSLLERFVMIILMFIVWVWVCIILMVCGSVLVSIMNGLLVFGLLCRISVMVLVAVVFLLSREVLEVGRLVRFVIIVWKLSSVLSWFWLILGW